VGWVISALAGLLARPWRNFCGRYGLDPDCGLPWSECTCFNIED
jgi:hypothetical protein